MRDSDDDGGSACAAASAGNRTDGTSAVAVASSVSLDAIDRRVIASSVDAGWRSLLVERHIVTARGQVIDVLPTEDQTVVVGLAGEQHIEVTGEGRQATTSFFDRDCVGLTPGGEGYRLRRLPTSRARTTEKVNIYIPAQVMSEVADDLRRFGGRAPRPLRALSRSDPTVGTVVRRLVRAVADGVPDLYGEAAATFLAAHLLAAHGGDGGRSAVGRSDAARVDAALTVIHESFGEPLSIAQLAAHANTSRYHFSRVFKTRVGCSPHEYLTRVRLQAARELLSSTDGSIAEVARTCGFSGPSYFASVFVKRFGVPPSACR